MRFPRRNRAEHARHLQKRLASARQKAEARRGEAAAAIAVPAKNGVHLQFKIEFEENRGLETALKSLENLRSGIRLMALRDAPGKEQDTLPAKLATVYIPAGKLKGFERRIRQYLNENTKEKGEPRHRKLIESLADVRLAVLESLWTDDPEVFPGSGQSVWWEVWLGSEEESALEEFRDKAEALGIHVGNQDLVFPDRRVLLAYGTPEQFATSVDLVDSLAELRRAKETPAVFMELPRLEMVEWVEDLVRRVRPPPSDELAVCLLDTGVTAGHPLLAPALDAEDTHSVDPAWGRHDHHGHGTEMAGLALHGDLVEPLQNPLPVELYSRLESVKILPPSGTNDKELWGAITHQAVSLVEASRPWRRRIHSMAVTAPDSRDRGQPTSWSATLDLLAAGLGEEPRRLIFVSAGNSDPEAHRAHPAHLDTEEIHDPGQAWNALTVGAFTEKWRIKEEDLAGWQPVARPGDLSPSTTTSLTWATPWPLKPDVVSEGGNSAMDPNGEEVTTPDSLSLLTTYHRPGDRPLTTSGDTSAATSLTARLAAAIWKSYPDLWPETLRALIAHSASWTKAMLERFKPLDRKGDYERMIRCCGHGVPSLERALWSAGNRLTLIAQESFQPFNKKAGASTVTMKEMHVHELPWPREELLALGETNIELRVTLSYFVEPNPARLGWKYRHRYASHGLRFDVRGATESREEFRKRINKLARDEEERQPASGDSSEWLLGTKLRHKGSLHSDIWRGTAADLASRQHIAVYPVTGWWKEYHQKGRWSQATRYALVVSITTPEIDVDLYTPVLNQVSIDIPGR